MFGFDQVKTMFASMLGGAMEKGHDGPQAVAVITPVVVTLAPLLASAEPDLSAALRNEDLVARTLTCLVDEVSVGARLVAVGEEWYGLLTHHTQAPVVSAEQGS